MQNPNQSPFGSPPLAPPSNPLPPGVSPTMSPAEERNWAIATHLASFSGYIGVPCGHVLGPLIIWLMKKTHRAISMKSAKKPLTIILAF